MKLCIIISMAQRKLLQNIVSQVQFPHKPKISSTRLTGWQQYNTWDYSWSLTKPEWFHLHRSSEYWEMIFKFKHSFKMHLLCCATISSCNLIQCRRKQAGKLVLAMHTQLSNTALLSIIAYGICTQSTSHHHLSLSSDPQPSLTCQKGLSTNGNYFQPLGQCTYYVCIDPSIKKIIYIIIPDTVHSSWFMIKLCSQWPF